MAVLATEWAEFKAITPEQYSSLLRMPVLVDLRNVYNTDEMERHGFTYYSVGRKPVVNVRVERRAS